MSSRNGFRFEVKTSNDGDGRIAIAGRTEYPDGLGQLPLHLVGIENDELYEFQLRESDFGLGKKAE